MVSALAQAASISSLRFRPGRGLLLLGLLLGAPVPASSSDQARHGWSFDAVLRERATLVTAIEFDQDHPDAGWFWNQRVTGTTSGSVTERVAATLSIVSALQQGIATTPVENNHLDLQQAFFDVALGSVDLRLGRQELRLGSQRLVATRDGTNVRRTWEGLRARAASGGWAADVFALRLVNVEPNGAFNDESDDARRLAGLYLTRSAGLSNIDVYYLFSAAQARRTISGAADQDRSSVGLRLFGERGHWFWNWEAVYQFGDHGSDDIRAWTLATNTGYRFAGGWSPELMISANVASGDSDPSDDRLETFDALYPRGSYFSELALLGPANFFNLNPYLRLTPNERLSVSFDVNAYWRLETADGVYGPPGNLLRAPGGSRERFVNLAASLALARQLNEHWQLALSLTHSRPQAFIEETGASDVANFAEFTIEARF